MRSPLPSRSAAAGFALLLCTAACGDTTARPPDAAPADASTIDALAPITFAPVPGTTMVQSATVPVGTRQVLLYAPTFTYDPAQAWVLLLNDGQDIGPLGLIETLENLWKQNKLPPMIVAALPVMPGGVRLQDYGTAEHDVAIPCDTGMQLLGTRAGDYARYVTGEVLPTVSRALGAPLAPARTGILGASLGGLSAVSIAWDHPERFGFAGAMSGSFWWRTMSGTVDERQKSRIMPAIVARTSQKPNLRAWFEAGTADETDDRDGDGLIDAIDDTLDLMSAMRTLGFQDDIDMKYRQVQDGIHGYPTWVWVFPEFLAWATGG